jgi:hypothetical protein
MAVFHEKGRKEKKDGRSNTLTSERESIIEER